MTVAELKTAIKQGALDRLFIFAGEEEYLKRHYIRELRAAILTDEAFDVFNHTVGEGLTLDIAMLREAVGVPPMMADRKLVEWHLPDLDRLKEDELTALSELAALCREVGWATVVIRAEKDRFDVGTLPKRPSKRYRELAAFAEVVDFPRATEQQLVGWIERHFAHEGIGSSPEIARALIARAGHSMDTLSNEIDKLVCLMKSKGCNTLSLCDLDGMVATTAEEDAFGLSNALLAHDPVAAYAQLNDLRRRRVDPLIVLGSVSRLYSELVAICHLRDEGMPTQEMAKLLKMHEYPLSLRLRALADKSAEETARALAACRALDAAAKGNGGIDPYVGLERLIAEFISK